MLKSSEMYLSEAQGLQLLSAGDVMGWLGGLPLSMTEDVRVGRPAGGARMAAGAGSVGAEGCAGDAEGCAGDAERCAGGTGECGVGSDCGGSGCCGIGGDCVAN